MPGLADVDALFKKLDPPLWLLTTQAGTQRGGLIATFVSPASIVPDMPRLVVGVARHHHTWKLLQEAGRFVVHLLEERHLDLVWQFGLRSSRDSDKFAGVQWTDEFRLADALAWLECRVEATFDIGDRTLYLAEVTRGQIERSSPPLTVQRLLALAPAERLAELRDGIQQDARTDAAAIASWRRQRTNP